jgi:hypothetical protein
MSDAKRPTMRRRVAMALSLSSVAAVALGLALPAGSCSAGTAGGEPCADLDEFGYLEWTYDGVKGHTDCDAPAGWTVVRGDPGRVPPTYASFLEFGARGKVEPHGFPASRPDPEFVCLFGLYATNWEPVPGSSGAGIDLPYWDFMNRVGAPDARRFSPRVDVNPRRTGCSDLAAIDGQLTPRPGTGTWRVRESDGTLAPGALIDLEVRDVEFEPFDGHVLRIDYARWRGREGFPPGAGP